MLLEQPCVTTLSSSHQRVTHQNAALLSEWLVTVSPSIGSCAITDPRETEWHSGSACHSKWSGNHYQLIERLMVQKWLQALPMGRLSAPPRHSVAARLGAGAPWEEKSIEGQETWWFIHPSFYSPLKWMVVLGSPAWHFSSNILKKYIYTFGDSSASERFGWTEKSKVN